MATAEPRNLAPDAQGFHADVIVIGSGFGGSVSALRLAEKGYTVIVVERGRRWRADEFPRSNWNIWKSMWLPQFGCEGPLRLTLLDDVMVLSGAAVGGGSIVYANTLLVPPTPFFRDPQWAEMADWQTDLAPHYRTAQRMLGAVPNPVLGPADAVLKAVADEMGRGDTVHVTDVGVYFGKPGVTVADPFFAGQGPERTGCNLCGACMTGCKHGAKNTLDKNYLWLAERLGVHVVERTEATTLRCIGGPDQRGAAGWEIELRPSLGIGRWFGSSVRLRARQVVCAAGVLGTLPLLLRSRDEGHLPFLPGALGDKLRTNSEAIVGTMGASDGTDYSKGIAITSGAHFDDHTHVEVVRYGKGQDALATLVTLLTDGGGRVPRAIRWLGTIARHPLQFLRSCWKFGWAEHGIILLVMQTLDNSLKAVWKRSRFAPWRKTLRTERPADSPANPTYIPIANEIARRVARKTGGIPMSALNEVLLDIPTTAHILGGCPIGPPGKGVIDADHRVYGCQGLLVCDGSMIPANLGVNPSLTITAMTERAMAQVPKKT
jgi:cholesterol oxidase